MLGRGPPPAELRSVCQTHPSMPAWSHFAGSLLPPNQSPKLLNPLTITPYPKLDPNDVNPPPSPISGNAATTMSSEFNPYVFPSTVPKNTMNSVKDTLGKWGKKAADATKKAQDLSGNVWQHYSLIGKQEPLHDYEEALKKKLITELLS
ncbi:hypothetical protein Rs2_16027 [Raphanus sativus]|nr:hypothetical protein Rs2_16027 [Raphanus sativus]